MCITTNPYLPIGADIMHKYVAGLAALKKMMRILSDKFKRGAQVVYLDVMEVRVRL